MSNYIPQNADYSDYSNVKLLYILGGAVFISRKVPRNQSVKSSFNEL